MLLAVGIAVHFEVVVPEHLVAVLHEESCQWKHLDRPGGNISRT